MKEGWVLSFAVGETAGKDVVSSSPKVPTPDLASPAASAIDLAEIPEVRGSGEYYVTCSGLACEMNGEADM
jgi:hypothetical protein